MNCDGKNASSFSICSMSLLLTLRLSLFMVPIDSLPIFALVFYDNMDKERWFGVYVNAYGVTAIILLSLLFPIEYFFMLLKFLVEDDSRICGIYGVTWIMAWISASICFATFSL